MAAWGFRRLALLVAMSLQSASPRTCVSVVVVASPPPPPPPRLVQTPGALVVRATTTPAAAASSAVSQCCPRAWWGWSISSSLPSSTTALSQTSFKVFPGPVPGFGITQGTMSTSSSSSTTPVTSSDIRSDVRPDEVLQFWFRELDPQNDVYNSKLWFAGGPDFDAECEKKFGECLELARKGELGDWMDTGRGRLALVIVLDQFSRNINRASPLQFSQDEKACEITLHTIQQGWHKELAPWERRFLYMPLMHSESLHHHEIAERVFKELADENVGNEKLYGTLKQTLDFQLQHSAVLRRFGRYPSRNALLGRQSTVEEEEYLSKGQIW